MSNEQTPKGVIYDAGYREYAGEYGGRVSAILSLVWDDFKRALGVKRGWVYKLFLYILVLGQFGIFLFMFFSDFLITQTLDAFQDAEQIGQFIGIETIRYYAFFSTSTTLIWFLSAMGAPWLMCQERKNRVLPLYFARPIKSSDYLLAKGLAISGLLFIFCALPVILLFLTKTALAPDAIAYFGENYSALLAILASAILISVFYASFSMGIASLVESPGIAAGSIIGLPFLASTVFGIMLLIAGDPLIQLANFTQSVNQVITWIFLGEIPAFQAIGAEDAGDGIASNIVAGLAPLPLWMYALQTALVTLLGLLVAIFVYRKEASR